MTKISKRSVGDLLAEQFRAAERLDRVSRTLILVLWVVIALVVMVAIATGILLLLNHDYLAGVSTVALTPPFAWLWFLASTFIFDWARAVAARSMAEAQVNWILAKRTATSQSSDASRSRPKSHAPNDATIR